MSPNPTANDNPLSDVVSNQYERWVYPEPILDLRAWLQNNWQWFDPSHAHPIFWPTGSYDPAIDILIAGCGSNQAAVFAYNNPQARVTGIDVSQSSLNHQQYLKDKYVLKNLDLQLLPIEQIGSLNRDFDLIVSTGVLHHLADPQAGLNALAQCIRPNGVIALMLYAKYGRIGVEMLQSVTRDLDLRQDEQSLQVVKDMLGVLPQNHPVKSYLSIAPDLQFDAGLVDTFLHGRDRSYSIDDCLDFVASAGLVFQDMFMKSQYYPASDPSNQFFAQVSTLPTPKQWAVMERIQFNNGCHFFMACRPDRPENTYKVDFSSEEAYQYVVTLRYRCKLNEQSIARYNWSLNLSAAEMAFARLINGQRTIADIITTAGAADALANHSPAVCKEMGLNLFKRLWQLDMVNMTW